MQSDEKEIQPNRISVTALIAPPLMRELSIEHWDELEEDVSEKLWALLGGAVHEVLLKYGTGEAFEVEKKIELKQKDKEIVGKIDLLDKAMSSVEDYKVTSVWSFMLGDKIEWERQLNCYAFLARVEGYNIEHLYINAILRDWQVNKVGEEGYPEIPFLRKEIPLWNFDKQENYIKARLILFSKQAQECTDEEKWKRGGKIALIQEGRKKALKLYDEDEANKITLAKGQHFEKRKVEYFRCLNYCRVRKFCPYNPYRDTYGSEEGYDKNDL
jgi:hypothetical protein